MMKLWKYILPLLAVVVFASCSTKDEAEVIPRSKMADIYMEMFITDQWISSTPGMRMIADTSLVYEPILEKYGYDKLDYIHSVNFYMDDPERFSRILRTTMDKIDKRISVLLKLKKQQELEAEAAKNLERFKSDYSFEEYFPYLADEPYVHYYDSLTFEADSSLVYRLLPIERADTIYDKLEMIVLTDTLSVCDTLPLSICDTLPKVDSVKVVERGIKKLNRPAKQDSMARRANLNSNNKLWQLSE